MVYDEDKQDFAPRFGHNRANDASKAWVLEHKEGKDGEGTRRNETNRFLSYLGALLFVSLSLSLYPSRRLVVNW
jgi:hypothetical protein